MEIWTSTATKSTLRWDGFVTIQAILPHCKKSSFDRQTWENWISLEALYNLRVELFHFLEAVKLTRSLLLKDSVKN